MSDKQLPTWRTIRGLPSDWRTIRGGIRGSVYLVSINFCVSLRVNVSLLEVDEQRGQSPAESGWVNRERVL